MYRVSWGAGMLGGVLGVRVISFCVLPMVTICAFTTMCRNHNCGDYFLLVDMMQ